MSEITPSAASGSLSHAASQPQGAPSSRGEESSTGDVTPPVRVEPVAKSEASAEQDSKVGRVRSQIEALEQRLRWEMQALEAAHTAEARAANAVLAGETADKHSSLTSAVQSARARIAGTEGELQVAKTELTQLLIDSGRDLAGSAVDVRV